MKLAMLLVVFSVFSVFFSTSFVSAQGAAPLGPPLAMQVWRLTDQDLCERVTGGLIHAPRYILKHEDHMRTREIKIQRDHERDDHHPQWVIEFREIQYLDPPQVGHPRREVRHSFRMVGTRHSAIVAIDNLPRKVSSRKMGRIFLMSVAERLGHRWSSECDPVGAAVLHNDILALLNETRFEDFVSLK